MFIFVRLGQIWVRYFSASPLTIFHHAPNLGVDGRLRKERVGSQPFYTSAEIDNDADTPPPFWQTRLRRNSSHAFDRMRQSQIGWRGNRNGTSGLLF